MMIRGLGKYQHIWRPWTNVSLKHAKAQNKPVLLYSGSNIISAEGLVSSPIIEKASELPELIDNYVPIQLQFSDRGVTQAFKSYLQAKTGEKYPPFFATVVNPHSMLPYAASTLNDQQGFTDFLQKNAELQEGELVDIQEKNLYCEVDVNDVLEQALMQYKEVSEQASYRYVMGYWNSVLFRKDAKFIDSELIKIANGGVVDHIGSGAFVGAYSVDWHFPDEIKDLASQSLLLSACAKSLTSNYDSTIHKLAVHLVAGIEEQLSIPTSLTWGLPESYMWDYFQFTDAIKPICDTFLDQEILFSYWGIVDSGNINDDLVYIKPGISHLNVLTPYRSVEEVADTFGASKSEVALLVEKSKEILWEFRDTYKRSELHTRRIYQSHAGLALSALSQVSKVVPEAKNVLSTALKLVCKLDFKHMVNCDDYAYSIRGLIDYYYTNKDPYYLNMARSLHDQQFALFWDSENGGFFYTLPSVNLFSRPKFTTDSLEPNYNGVSALNMLDLGQLCDKKYTEQAAQTLKLAGSKLETEPLTHLSFVDGMCYKPM